MEQHQESVVENRNEKEEIVAPSPDSGISLSYEEENSFSSNSVQGTKDSEKTSPPPTKRIQCIPSQNTLYPFFYKYPDNRKLTLLKSLSQDSEYSLDTSLFDAEDFLQEMGFAGSGDPTIPERFLPSLLQRLSKFPESEIESLNDRIIQSIGCFKRKEGKRRLFRNLSMGKSEQNHGSCLSGVLNNSYPLIRSNTGPASFSFNNASSTSEGNYSSQDRRSSLNNSNNSSFSEETLFPQSPIAILVSAASEDYEEKCLQEKSLCEQAISNSDKVDTAFQLNNQIEDNKNRCSAFENKVANRLKESPIDADDTFSHQINSDEKMEQDSQNAPQNIIESKQAKEDNEELQTEDKMDLVVLSNCGSEVSNENEWSSSSILNSSSMIHDNICSIVKPPLRRLSQTVNCSQQNFTSFGTLAYQDNYRDFDYPNLISETSNSKLNYEEGQNNTENDNSVSFDSLHDISESTSSISGKEDTDSLSGMTKQELFPPISENNKFASLSDSVGVEVKIKQTTFNKPKYTRDDSLTNFLSSMLDTNDSLSPNSPESSQVFNFDYTAIKNRIKGPELPSSNPFIQKEIIVKTEISHDNSSQDYTNKESKAANTLMKENIPKRKRRMLRRMSSSINHYDEETSVTNSEPSNFVPHPLQPLSSPPSSHLPLRNTISAPQILSCRAIHPCCCLPSRNISSRYGTRRKNSIENHDDFSCSSQYDCNTRKHPFEEAMVFSSNRKLKRLCNRNRFLSCPPSIANFNPFCESQSVSVSTHSLNIDPSCGHTCHHYSPPYSRCFPSPVDMWGNGGFQNKTTTSFQCGYSSDTQSSGTWRGMSKLDRKCAPRSHFCSLPTDQAPLAAQNAEKLDYDDHEESTPVVSRECKSFHSNKDSYIQSKSRRDRTCFQKQASTLSPHISKESYLCNDIFLSESEPHCVFQREIISDNYYKSKEVDEFQVCSSPENRGIQLLEQLSHKDHPEYQLPNNLQSSVPSKEELISVENNSISFPSQYSKLDINCNCNKPLKISNSYPLQNPGASWNNADTRKSNRRTFSSNENMNVKSSDSCDSGDQSSPQNNKREALYEKKLRAFSKFLNSLTKSALDAKFENDCKTISNSKSPDKATEYCLSNLQVKNSTANDEDLTASPELDKLVKLLNSMEFSKNSEKYNQGSREECDFQNNKGVSPVYENRVSLEINDANQPHFIPVSYTSSISMQISDDDKELHTNRKEKEFVKKSTVRKEPSLCKRKNTIQSYSLQMSFKEVSKELEELQLSIQKAKEMRISASKELRLLQELLSKDACEDHESIIEKNSSKVTNESQNADLTSDMKKELEALADLRNKSDIGESEDAEFWQKEMKKIKEENDQAWRAKLDVLEQRLASQEEELRMVQSVNENLQKQLQLQMLGSPSCHCRSDIVQNGFRRIGSAFEDDEEYINHKSSIPIQSSRQECERLQEQLMEAEQRADQLNLLLNQKLIELNKLQLTLSKQTKEMIELEKSYLQLQCKLRKGTSKPVVAKLCSRTSPFNSKNLCPKPSPPASPHPNGLS